MKPGRIEPTNPVKLTSQPVDRTAAGESRSREIQREATSAQSETRESREKRDANESRQTQQRQPDQFRQTTTREQVARALSQRIEQAQAMASLILRLPGRGRVIEDRRDLPEHHSSEHDDARAHQTRDERANDAREKSEHDKRATERDPHALAGEQAANPRRGVERTMNPATAQILAELALAEAQATEGGAATGGRAHDGELTSFERAIVERFEKGLAQAHSNGDGAAKLAPKDASQWKNFFAQFLTRTEKRQIPMDAIADALLFRGLLQKKGADGVGIFIGDVQLTSGALEKFARFEVSLQRIMQYVQHLAPGATVDKQIIAQVIASELLEYFAIAPDSAGRAFAGGMLDQGGIFLSRRVESDLANTLGIPQRQSTTQDIPESTAHARRGFKGIGGGLDPDSDASQEDPLDMWRRFLPWRRIDREERFGRRRWFVTITWLTIITAGGISLWLLARNFL